MRDKYRAKLWEIKEEAPCDYLEQERLKDLESEVEFEKQKHLHALHLIITPELEDDPLHKGLIKRFISF